MKSAKLPERFSNPMKSTIPLLVLVLTTTLAVSSEPETLAWWRLDGNLTEPAEGGPLLKWWTNSGTPPEEDAAPPQKMFRATSPAETSFAVSKSVRDHPGGLHTIDAGDFAATEQGLTVEGFFQTTPRESGAERQAVITCGDGWMDAAWAVRLIDGQLAFSVFGDFDHQPVVEARLPGDFLDNRWHYFVGRVIPGDGAQPGKLQLEAVADGGQTTRVETDWPAGFVPRQNRRPVVLGRSSLYIDNDPDYRGTWDTFQGSLSDIRITRGVLSNDSLLGALP
jgi:hypothetical protein